MRLFLDRLKIEHKLAVLCSAFLLPIIFLTYLFIAETEKQVTFALKEVEGSSYVAALATELRTLIALSQGTTSLADLAKAQSEVLKQDRDKAEAMNVVDPAAKAADAVRAAQALPKDSPAAAYDPAIDAVLGHIAKVADGAGLNIDPDLDSFHTEDVATENMPAVVVAASRVLDAALAIVATDQPTPEMTVRFLTRKGERAAALKGLAGAVTSAERGNRDGTVKAALETAYGELMARSAAYGKLLDSLAAGGQRPTADALREAQGAMQQASGVLWKASIAELDHLVNARIAELNARMAWSLFLTFAVFLASVALAWWVARSISRPLYRLHQTMHDLALGNMAVTVPHTERSDEIGVMARDVEVFKEDAIELSQLVEQVIASARQVAIATDQASGAVGQVSEGAQAQLSALRRVAAAVTQSTAAITEVSHSTQGAHELSGSIAGQVGDGQERMRAMAEVVRGTAETAKRAEKMAESISQIADQTHMVALNAAIEAARAGEHSKGFAVVAEEVRKLAEHSGELAREIGQVVRSATAESQMAVSMVEEVNAKMDSISQNVRRNDTLTAAVATSMEEQQATVTEINQSIDGLARIAQSNATAAEEIAATMIDLSRLAEQSKGQVEGFARNRDGDAAGPAGDGPLPRTDAAAQGPEESSVGQRAAPLRVVGR
jgi:methyl-accepting chemotaxis protein